MSTTIITVYILIGLLFMTAIVAIAKGTWVPKRDQVVQTRDGRMWKVESWDKYSSSVLAFRLDPDTLDVHWDCDGPEVISMSDITRLVRE